MNGDQNKMIGDKMKIIFLDIDGVLNSKETLTRANSIIGIDPFLVSIFNRIIFATDAKIVISSSWRNSESEREEIRKRVMPFLDITPNCKSRIRGDEIKEWLDKQSDVEKYAILDDDSDMLKEQLPNFFHTTWENGLTEEIANEVIKHLNGTS